MTLSVSLSRNPTTSLLINEKTPSPRVLRSMAVGCIAGSAVVAMLAFRALESIHRTPCMNLCDHGFCYGVCTIADMSTFLISTAAFAASFGFGIGGAKTLITSFFATSTDNKVKPIPTKTPQIASADKGSSLSNPATTSSIVGTPKKAINWKPVAAIATICIATVGAIFLARLAASSSSGNLFDLQAYTHTCPDLIGFVRAKVCNNTDTSLVDFCEQIKARLIDRYSHTSCTPPVVCSSVMEEAASMISRLNGLETNDLRSIIDAAKEFGASYS